MKPKIASSAGYVLLIYSYRAKYNGLLATFFHSSREMLFRGLMFLNFVFSFGFFVLIEGGLGGVSLGMFMC